MFSIIYERTFFIKWNLFPIIAIIHKEYIATLKGSVAVWRNSKSSKELKAKGEWKSAFGLLITGGVAEASTTYDSYSKKVPAFNGSAYTGYQGMTGYDTKSETIDIISKSVGGDYTVDIRAQRDSGEKTPWQRNVGDDTSWTFYTNYLNDSDHSYRLQLSNDLSTPVKVLATGSFRTH